MTFSELYYTNFNWTPTTQLEIVSALTHDTFGWYTAWIACDIFHNNTVEGFDDRIVYILPVSRPH